MLMFWIIIVLMLFIAMAFIIWPLFQAKALRWLVLILIIIPAVSLTLYRHWGASQQLSPLLFAKKNADQVRVELMQLGTREEVIKKLKVKLQHAPDAQGYFLLGRLYLGGEQFKQATIALSEANQLKPDDIDIMETYSEALFLENHHELNAYAKGLVNKILKKQPNNTNAINLLALDAFSHKRYQKAIHYWETLLPTYAPDSEEEKMLLEMIAKTRQSMSAIKPH